MVLFVFTNCKNCWLHFTSMACIGGRALNWMLKVDGQADPGRCTHTYMLKRKTRGFRLAQPARRNSLHMARGRGGGLKRATGIPRKRRKKYVLLEWDMHLKTNQGSLSQIKSDVENPLPNHTHAKKSFCIHRVRHATVIWVQIGAKVN